MKDRHYDEHRCQDESGTETKLNISLQKITTIYIVCGIAQSSYNNIPFYPFRQTSNDGRIEEEAFGFYVLLWIDHGQYVDGRQPRHSNTFSSTA